MPLTAAMPKSVRTIRPSCPSRMLAGLTSRCHTPMSWAARSASTTARPIRAASAVGSAPRCSSASSRVIEGTYSITMHGRPSSSTASCTTITWGWAIRAALRASRRVRSWSVSSGTCGGRGAPSPPPAGRGARPRHARRFPCRRGRLAARTGSGRPRAVLVPTLSLFPAFLCAPVWRTITPRRICGQEVSRNRLHRGPTLQLACSVMYLRSATHSHNCLTPAWCMAKLATPRHMSAEMPLWLGTFSGRLRAWRRLNTGEGGQWAGP